MAPQLGLASIRAVGVLARGEAERSVVLRRRKVDMSGTGRGCDHRTARGRLARTEGGSQHDSEDHDGSLHQRDDSILGAAR